MVFDEAGDVGAADENGTYNGGTGYLQRGEVDFSSMPTLANLPGHPFEETDSLGFYPTQFLQKIDQSNKAKSIDFFVQLASSLPISCWLAIVCLLSSALIMTYNTNKYSKKNINLFIIYCEWCWALSFTIVRQSVTKVTSDRQRLTFAFIAFCFPLLSIAATSLIGTRLVYSGTKLFKSYNEMFEAQNLNLVLYQRGFAYQKFKRKGTLENEALQYLSNNEKDKSNMVTIFRYVTKSNPSVLLEKPFVVVEEAGLMNFGKLFLCNTLYGLE